jgi:hemoglobin
MLVEMSEQHRSKLSWPEAVVAVMDLLDTQLYELIGADGFMRLVTAFYRRVITDDMLRPLYPAHDMAGAETRLREFLIMRFGGPDDYARRRGHPRLRMRHARFSVTQAARDRWIQLMDQALAEVRLPAPAEPMLRQFFADAGTFLINAN